jgi:hypothetical protein
VSNLTCKKHGTVVTGTSRASDKSWIWKCRFYYHDGCLAFETVHKSDASKDMEVRVSESRHDIGKIEVMEINRG